ncbi:MAG: DUF1488 family protein [Hyphomicrobiaceae bacterium]
MPLHGSGRDAIEEIDGYYFAMLAPDGSMVRCKVTAEALQDAMQKYNPTSADCLDVFRQNRAKIEQIASDAYDRGEKPPTVSSAALNG